MTVFASNACADFIVPFGARAINASRSSAFSFDASAKTSFGVTALRTSSKKPFWIMTIFRCRRLLLLPNDDDDDDDDFGEPFLERTTAFLAVLRGEEGTTPRRETAPKGAPKSMAMRWSFLCRDDRLFFAYLFLVLRDKTPH